MKVKLLVHLEAAEGDRPFVWWAESPQVAGLSVAADHLRDVLERSDSAIRALLSEQGVDVSDLAVEPVLCAIDEESTRGVEVEAREDEAPEHVSVRQVTLVAPAAA